MEGSCNANNDLSQALTIMHAVLRQPRYVTCVGGVAAHTQKKGVQYLLGAAFTDFLPSMPPAFGGLAPNVGCVVRGVAKPTPPPNADSGPPLPIPGNAPLVGAAPPAPKAEPPVCCCWPNPAVGG